MFGTNIALNHQVAQARSRDFLAEAELQRSADLALAGQGRFNRAPFTAIRASVASALLRAGSWLMPEDAAIGRRNPAARALELRPGQ